MDAIGPSLVTTGDRIRFARKNAKLTQLDVATACGISKAAISDWESPSGVFPRIEHAIIFSEMTSVSIHWLITGKYGPGEDVDKFKCSSPITTAFLMRISKQLSRNNLSDSDMDLLETLIHRLAKK